MEELFELTKEQQKAFNRLEKAYSYCKSTGIFFYNNYGCLSAADSKIINGYGDRESGPFDDCSNPNSFEIANEWTDDHHYFNLTDK